MKVTVEISFVKEKKNLYVISQLKEDQYIDFQGVYKYDYITMKNVDKEWMKWLLKKWLHYVFE